MIRVSVCNKKKHRQLIAWFAISFGLGIVLHKVFFFIICSFNNNELRNAPMAKLFISCTGQSPVFLDYNLRRVVLGRFLVAVTKFQDKFEKFMAKTAPLAEMSQIC